MAKYAVALFRISFSIFSCAFSARSRDSSICFPDLLLIEPTPLSRLHPIAQRLAIKPKCSNTSGIGRFDLARI
jgi:hypothetical protein